MNAKIETALPESIMPGLLLQRIHTEEGIVGRGEMYHVQKSVSSLRHDWRHHYLLGKNPRDIEKHLRFLYERTTNFGTRGTELRAIFAANLLVAKVATSVQDRLAAYRRLFGLTVADKWFVLGPTSRSN